MSYDFHSHHKLKKNKSSYNKKGLTGLINIGNTCFLNSTIQCLSHTLKLTDYFLSEQYLEDNKEIITRKRPEWKFVNAYVILVDAMWEHNQLIKPRSIRDQLIKSYSKYNSFEQQDAHECLFHILDLLHKGLRYEIDVEIKGEVKTPLDKLYKEALESWKNFYQNDYSYIVELFHGQLYSSISCLNTKCDYKSNVFEPFSTISLSIPNSDCNIEDCFKNYLSIDYIDNYNCSDCKNTKCSKQAHFWSLPNYLIVHLKRFDNQNNKIQSHVEFPIDNLDLTPFISKDKHDKNNYIYSLYAVTYHSGDTSNGHYWSSCRNLDGNWYNFNDGNITKYTKLSKNTIVNNNAYILFYYRKFIE